MAAEPRSYLGRHQARPLDAAAEKSAGWLQHGIPVVSVRDRRLTWPERGLVRQLGTKLYGPRRDDAEEPHGR